jgi:hypothetical protein
MCKTTEHPSSAYVRALAPGLELDLAVYVTHDHRMVELGDLLAAVWDRAYAAGHTAGAAEFGRGWDAAVGVMRGGHDR